MDNPEYLEILRQGVEVWNKWRHENPGIEVSFSDIPLDDLRYVNFEEAFLFDVDFDGVDLSGANLSYVKVTGSTFRCLPDINENTTTVTKVIDGVEEKWLDCDVIRACLKKADLSHSDFYQCAFMEADLHEADLSYANFMETDFICADLSNTLLRKTRFHRTDFSHADLRGADLTGAELLGADFSGADLASACLREANLTGANLSGANLSGANLTGCFIHGVSVWGTCLEGTIQSDLILSRKNESVLTVDNLEVAQFIYLLLNNQKIRNVIDTITSKVVLILGRFTAERKLVLDALRDELRKHNFSPVVFDFDPSAERDLTETISTLAHMSRFVIADLTDAKSIPQELQAIVPHLPSVPIQPILHRDATEYAMFEHYERYPWVLPIYRYQDIPHLLSSIKDPILKSVEQKEHEKEKTRSLEEEAKNRDERIRELEEKVRMLEQNK